MRNENLRKGKKNKPKKVIKLNTSFLLLINCII